MLNSAHLYLWYLCGVISRQGVKQETFPTVHLKQEAESELKPPNKVFPASVQKTRRVYQHLPAAHLHPAEKMKLQITSLSF